MKITDSEKRILEYLAFALILILATVLSCYRIAEPAWDGTHYGSSLHGVSLDGWHGFTLYEWDEVARNYLKFGYLATKLGQVRGHGWVQPESGFNYRVDHPPLPPLLVSVSFRLFGIHEWSVRLIPVLSSLLMPILVFILMSKWGGNKAALLASLFLVLTPMYAYYSKLPTSHIPTSSFSLLTFVFYYWWTETGKRSYYLGMYVGLVVAILSDWVGYFVAPAILLHYIIHQHGKAKNLKFVLSFGILPVVFLVAHFGWSYLLAGEEAIDFLFDRFLLRTISGGAQEGRFVFTLWDFYASTYARSKFFLTPMILILSTVWFIDFLLMPLHKKLSKKNTFLGALFFFGLCHNLVFSNRVFIHDFDVSFHLLPFFAITAAFGVQRIAQRVLRDKRPWIALFILAILYFYGKQSISALERLHSVYVDADLFLIGSKVNEITDRNASVMSNFKPGYMILYADRVWPVVTDFQDLTSRLQTDPSHSHYVYRDGESVGRELGEYLVRNHLVETFYGYSFFDLRETGSNTILQNPQIEHRITVNFDDKLLFLGYEVEEVVQKKRGPSWLKKYLKGHAELLPEHRTFFHITYFWQCLEEMEEDYTLVTQFEGYRGQTYRIDQGHQGVNGAYPTSMWREGEVIREEYQVEVPADYPPIRYALWLGVRDGEAEPLEVVSDAEKDEQDRVRLGQIEVLPAESPTPLATEPHPQNRVEMNINDDLMFLGYDLSERNPRPGDQLKVTTYWQSLRKTETDYAIQVALRNGGYKLREISDIAPTRLWEEGKYYQGNAMIAVNPSLLGGTYSLDLDLEKDDGTGTQIALASWDIPWQRRHIIRRLGKANYGGSEILSPDEPLSLRFNLKEKETLELVVGWTGKAEGDETRVEVYISQPYVRERFLGTWVIRSGRYATTKRSILDSLTAPGENVIELRVPELRERVHNIGWRGVVDRVFPDLLQDPRTDYDGPIQMDFAQVSSRWEGNWDDYYDLAEVYAERGMMGEVARLYEEAVEEGVEPRRVDDLSLFKSAYRALGEEGKIGEIEARIVGRIAQETNVNLGGKVQFLGYSLTSQYNDSTQMSLFFRCVEEMDEDYTLWVHGEVEDESLLEGQRREARYAVFDHLLPTSRWRIGEVYQDDEVKGLKPGRYHFTLGLWRPEDESRLWRGDDPNAHIIELGWVEVR